MGVINICCEVRLSWGTGSQEDQKQHMRSDALHTMVHEWEICRCRFQWDSSLCLYFPNFVAAWKSLRHTRLQRAMSYPGARLQITVIIGEVAWLCLFRILKVLSLTGCLHTQRKLEGLEALIHPCLSRSYQGNQNHSQVILANKEELLAKLVFLFLISALSFMQPPL